MKTLLISLHSRHAQNILAGNKTIELRRTAPRHISHAADTETFIPGFKKILIYETSPTMSIVGYCTPIKVYWGQADKFMQFADKLCLTPDEISSYLGDKAGWGIGVKDARRIVPIPLAQMRELGISPPQVYQYLDDELVYHLCYTVAQ